MIVRNELIWMVTDGLVYVCYAGKKTRGNSGSLNVAGGPKKGERVCVYVNVVGGGVRRGGRIVMWVVVILEQLVVGIEESVYVV
jgi:hypothetical protein